MTTQKHIISSIKNTLTKWKSKQILTCRTGRLIHKTQSQKGIIYYLILSLIVAAIQRCPNPEDIDRGSVRVVDIIRFYHRLYASYSCEIGHELEGQSRRNCDLFTGEWEGPAPTCEECKLISIQLTTIELWKIVFIYSTHYIQHLSTVDILEMLPMEQWMSQKGLNYVQLLGTHVMKDSYTLDHGLEHVDLMAGGVGQPLFVKVRHLVY